MLRAQELCKNQEGTDKDQSRPSARKVSPAEEWQIWQLQPGIDGLNPASYQKSQFRFVLHKACKSARRLPFTLHQLLDPLLPPHLHLLLRLPKPPGLHQPRALHPAHPHPHLHQHLQYNHWNIICTPLPALYLGRQDAI